MPTLPTAVVPGTPTLRLLEALRAGSTLEAAAATAKIPLAAARSVAGSPLAQVLLRKTI